MKNISPVLLENENLLNMLTDNYANKSLPNSLIIHGAKGIGKSTFSFFLIKNIYSKLTSNNSKAHHINLINNNTHPNIKYIQNLAYILLRTLWLQYYQLHLQKQHIPN